MLNNNNYNISKSFNLQYSNLLLDNGRLTINGNFFNSISFKAISILVIFSLALIYGLALLFN